MVAVRGDKPTPNRKKKIKTASIRVLLKAYKLFERKKLKGQEESEKRKY